MATASADTVPFGNGQLTVTTIAHNAVRIQYQEGEAKQELPEWIYVNNIPVTFRMCVASHAASPK